MRDFESTALRVKDNALYVLDQTQLPHKEIWLESRDPAAMVKIIRALSVRGAPLIGVAAALQLGFLAEQGGDGFEKALVDLYEARPTAVNLMNAIERLKKVYLDKGLSAVPAEAEKICREDVELCEKMARNGVKVLKDGDRVLTHCNTGGLATAGLGTALGVLIEGKRQGLKLHVIADETRPLLQGGRLTTWELQKNEIPFTLICDNMAGFLMQRGEVDKVLVGADRIARNGDFANKVGTYSLAVLCKHHKIPFYVVAPQTTVDPECANGAGIPIEEREPHEVHGTWAPKTSKVWNPAFDVTPAELVTGWILDRGIFNIEQVREGALCGR
jgi:methylthioribose-1-phosphate isomerase